MCQMPDCGCHRSIPLAIGTSVHPPTPQDDVGERREMQTSVHHTSLRAAPATPFRACKTRFKPVMKAAPRCDSSKSQNGAAATAASPTAASKRQLLSLTAAGAAALALGVAPKALAEEPEVALPRVFFDVSLLECAHALCTGAMRFHANQ